MIVCVCVCVRMYITTHTRTHTHTQTHTRIKTRTHIGCPEHAQGYLKNAGYYALLPLHHIHTSHHPTHSSHHPSYTHHSSQIHITSSHYTGVAEERRLQRHPPPPSHIHITSTYTHITSSQIHITSPCIHITSSSIHITSSHIQGYLQNVGYNAILPLHHLTYTSRHLKYTSHHHCRGICRT